MASRRKTPAKPRAKKKAKKKTGRPKESTPAKLAESLLDHIADGETLSSWCRIKGRPAARTVRAWKTRDAGFAAAYAHAREIGGDLIADRMRETAQNRTKYRDDVNHRKLKIDTDKWLLARWFPTSYGDRVALAGDAAVPLHQEPPTDIQAAREIAHLMAQAGIRRMKAKG